VITQCSIRHLYTTVPQSTTQIDLAKTFERRRCNHHTLDQPLSTLDCVSSVLDPKSSHTNKHRYVVASQDDEVRRHMRAIPGVPLVYVRRSVMVMEPMAESSEGVREGLERSKFRSGLKSKRQNTGTLKRKRDADEESGGGDGNPAGSTRAAMNGVVNGEAEMDRAVKKKRTRGPKGPNPLSIKKPKTRESAEDHAQEAKVAKEAKQAKQADLAGLEAHTQPNIVVDIVATSTDGAQVAPPKRRRKRTHKSIGADNLHTGPILDSEAQDP